MLGLSFGVFEINCAWLEEEGGDPGSNLRSEGVRYGRIEEDKVGDSRRVVVDEVEGRR